MRHFGALIVISLMLLGLAAQGWTVEDCEAVNYDHPDCNQYPTTTIPEVTTTIPEVTTTTPNQTTTTVNTDTPPTTLPTPTTTIPFDSIPPTTAPPIVTTAPPTTEETLPFTGANTSSMVGLGAALAAGAAILLAASRRIEENDR